MSLLIHQLLLSEIRNPTYEPGRFSVGSQIYILRIEPAFLTPSRKISSPSSSHLAVDFVS